MAWFSNLLEFTLLLPDEPFGWLTPGTNHWTWHWCLCSGCMNATKMPTLIQCDSLTCFTSFPLGDGVWHYTYYLMPHIITERMGSIRMVPQTICGGATWISWHNAENHSHWEKQKYELIFKTCDHILFQQWELNKGWPRALIDCVSSCPRPNSLNKNELGHNLL